MNDDALKPVATCFHQMETLAHRVVKLLLLWLASPSAIGAFSSVRMQVTLTLNKGFEERKPTYDASRTNNTKRTPCVSGTIADGARQ
jgi:hypothetical protein